MKKKAISISNMRKIIAIPGQSIPSNYDLVDCPRCKKPCYINKGIDDYLCSECFVREKLSSTGINFKKIPEEKIKEFKKNVSNILFFKDKE